MDQQAQELHDQARTVERTARGIISWIEKNEGDPNVRQGKVGLLKEFRRFAATASRQATAATRPMCVGVFGPSQNGKSHLIATLARKPGSEAMLTQLGENRLDFIKDINPGGGRESTGLVTRFSLRPFDAPRTYGPVPLRLLSQTDIVKIIGNFYYNDVADAESEAPGDELIKAVLVEAAKAAGAPDPGDKLDADDVYDLQAYFEKAFLKKSARVRELRKHFWDEAANLAPRLKIADRARLFGVIWNGEPKFTALYERLYKVLAQLDFSANAFAGLDALQPRERSIINVDTLRGLGTDQTDTVQITSENGRPVSIARCDVAAIVAELHLQIVEKSHDFFDHTDLLDFPGARSRMEIGNLAAHLAKEESLVLLFRRGKVSYLFERYCAEQELTSMLLCIRDELPEVLSLPQIVNDWIVATHGETPEQRSQVRTSLFFILTFFDRAFQANVGDTSLTARWTARLSTSLVEFFGAQHDWPKVWDRKGPFRNCFWFRNTTLRAEDIFNYDAHGRETEIRNEKLPVIADLKRGFLDAPSAMQHFEDPSKAFDAGLALNDGGASYLAEKLTPICDPELKRDQIRARLARLRDEMVDRIAPFHISGNPEEEIERRKLASKAVAQSLIKCAGAQRFGHLLASLQVTEDDLEGIYYRLEMGSGADGPSADMTIGQSPREREMVEAIFGPEGAGAMGMIGERDDARRFAEGVVAAWIRDMDDLAANEGFCEQVKLPSAALRDLVKEITAGARRLDLEQSIAETVRNAILVRMKFQKLVKLPVRLSAQLINAYINHLGYDGIEVAKRPRTRAGQTPIFLPRPAPQGIPQIPAQPTHFDQPYYIDWITGFLDLVDQNTRTSSGGVINVESNRQLGQYLTALNLRTN